MIFTNAHPIQILQPGVLTWLVGIEDTCVYPPSGVDAPALDEHALTGHVGAWKDDLTLARDLGATAVRYGASWPLVHRAPGIFDWSHLDQVVDHAVHTLGLGVVADLVHYGCPPWLTGSFTDRRFPAALAEFAGAFATRYRGVVDHLTPLNEPLTTASFCGLRGVWPPYRTGWAGWTAVTVAVAQGVVAATHAVRAANPDAVIVHVEAAMPVQTDNPELLAEADLLANLAYLGTDLIRGHVDGAHPMRPWLVEHGASPAALDSLVAWPGHVDILGINYYPDLSPRDLVRHKDQVVQLCTNRGAAGLRAVLEDMVARYRLPLALTETSIEGNDAARSAWLRDAARAVSGLLADGMDLRGLTWWPLCDFVDWSYASGGVSVEEFVVATEGRDGSRVITAAPSLGDPADGITPFLRRMGLARLDATGDGTLARHPTAAAGVFRTLSESTRLRRTPTSVITT